MEMTLENAAMHNHCEHALDRIKIENGRGHATITITKPFQ